MMIPDSGLLFGPPCISTEYKGHDYGGESGGLTSMSE